MKQILSFLIQPCQRIGKYMRVISGLLVQKKHIPYVLVAFCSLFLIIFKAGVLSYPHYWDEAFPYSYAIGHMTENKPGILSTSAPSIYTTGHPMLYYFLQSGWNLIVGSEMLLQRIFPLLISLFSLFVLFAVGKKMFTPLIGAAAVVLYSTQNVFLAQSSFQLPETTLSLFFLLSIYFFLQRKQLLFILSTSLMLFTKEPAIALLGAMFIADQLLFQNNKTFRARIASSWVFVIPVLLNFLFYLHQYYAQGWFLFPRHTNFMEFDIAIILDKFSRYFSYLFIYYGRNAISFLIIVFAAILLVKNRKSIRLSTPFKHVILLFILIVGFLLFSALNFYSNRYILCLFPVFSLLSAAVIYYTIKSELLSLMLVAALAGVTMYFSLTIRGDKDHNLGYADAVKVQQQVVDYCVANKWQEKKIMTGFLMSKNLTSHYPGYVHKDSLFIHIQSEDPASADILLLTSTEKYIHACKETPGFILLKRFEYKNSWAEIYVHDN